MRVWAIVADGVLPSRSELLPYNLSDWKFEALPKISGKRSSKFANAMGLRALVFMARIYPNTEKVSILIEVSVMLYDKASSVSVIFIYF